MIRSDPHLLEQIIRNLLSNALKYTKQGKILLGCRRHGGTLSIEIWDTGIGIPEGELKTIFNEYHQIDNTAREYSRGLGLGLSIVQRLADLLGHRVQVRSRPGRGSVFAIEIAHKPHKPRESEPLVAPVPLRSTAATAPLVGTILVAEDDPEIRDLLDRFLRDSGHRTAVAADGVAALALVARGAVNPDLVLADYSMPRAMTGQQLVTTLRARLRRPLPAIILTGDISTDALRDITASDCVHLNKPVKLAKLAKTVQDLLAQARAAVPMQATESATPVIFVVDDDASVRSSLSAVLQDDGRTVETYASCEAFLEVWKPGTAGCLLLDAYLPGMSGFDLLAHCTKGGHFPPTIMMTGVSDVKTAVRSMHAGALDFIEKPVGRADLIASIDRAIEQSSDAAKRSAWQDEASGRVAALTPRQREILGLVLAGKPSKVIAADLGISQRTVEAHRAAIMEKTGATSLPALARLALAATWTDHSPFAS